MHFDSPYFEEFPFGIFNMKALFIAIEENKGGHVAGKITLRKIELKQSRKYSFLTANHVIEIIQTDKLISLPG